MPAIKDKLIMVPLEDTDLINNLENLPRMPSECGIIDIQWKRKLAMKNYYLQAKVNMNRIYKFLHFLRDSNNPHYRFFHDKDEFVKRCQDIGDEEYEKIYDIKTAKAMNVEVEFVSDDSVPKIVELDDFESLTPDEREEENWRRNDNIRKFQIDYDEHITLTPKYPEAFHSENQPISSDVYTIAPGEGKIPESLLFCENWDALAYPVLHPHGINNLHEKRKVKLDDDLYFKQRINNIDPRFRKNASYIFAAEYYLSKKALQKNIDLSYKRGTRQTSSSGKHVYSLEDAFSVYDNMTNTPSYQKKSKNEQIARIENLGPFQAFFTLSCADTRWSENLIALLRERGDKILYEMNDDYVEKIKVKDSKGNALELTEYLTGIDESFHELLRKNVVTATRIFKHRFTTFLHEVVLNKCNPMHVEHYSYKVEFQGRGAAHYHGVLWLDLHNLERLIITDEIVQGNDFEYRLSDVKDGSNEQRIFHKFTEIDMKDKSSDAKNDLYCDLQPTFPFIGLVSAFDSMRQSKTIMQFEEMALINFANTFTSVSTHQSIVGDRTAKIVKEVNTHRHTKTCTKYGTKSCRFKFPKFPSKRTLISQPMHKEISEKEKNEKIKVYNRILIKVKDVIENESEIEKILSKYDKSTEDKTSFETNRALRIEEMLTAANLSQEEKNLYEASITYNPAGYSFVMARDIDETMINSYNPEWAGTWDGNSDFQITLDHYAVVTYINDYFTKDDTGMMKKLIESLKSEYCKGLKDKMVLMMNTWLTHRQMGLAETVYKIFRDFHFRESSESCVFVQARTSGERSKYLIRADGKPEYNVIIIHDF